MWMRVHAQVITFPLQRMEKVAIGAASDSLGDYLELEGRWNGLP